MIFVDFYLKTSYNKPAEQSVGFLFSEVEHAVR